VVTPLASLQDAYPLRINEAIVVYVIQVKPYLLYKHFNFQWNLIKTWLF